MAGCFVATEIALPRYSYSQEEIGAAVEGWLAGQPEKAAKARGILAHAGVVRRHTVRPLEWYPAHPSVTERSEAYREEMIALCTRAAEGVLERARVAPEAVGLIVSTSSTGFMVPAVETYLMSRIPFSPQARRMPLTELGCAGAGTGVNLAEEFLRANPESSALIVAAELTSLTAQVSDFSMANIVSAALFGDGAAATLIAGEKFAFPRPAATGGPGDAGAGPEQRPLPRIVATRSVLFPHTHHLMGFDNTDGGLKVVLSPQLPRFLRAELPSRVEPFLAEHGLGVADLTHFLLHPGGPKVIAALEKSFGLSREQTRFSHEVLQEYGNLSSATVLFVLHRFERQGRPDPGDYGLMMAVGPGLCAEMALLQW